MNCSTPGFPVHYQGPELAQTHVYQVGDTIQRFHFFGCVDLTVDHNKFWKRWEYQTTLLVSWETCMQVKKQQLEPDMEQYTDSKLGMEYVKTVYCHLAYLTYMQSTSCKMPDWMKHKLESRLLGKISITSDMQMTLPFGRKWRGTKEPLDEGERGEWKSWLKAQH